MLALFLLLLILPGQLLLLLLLLLLPGLLQPLAVACAVSVCALALAFALAVAFALALALAASALAFRGRPWKATPATSPAVLKTGPPLLPPLMAASIWTTSKMPGFAAADAPSR